MCAEVFIELWASTALLSVSPYSSPFPFNLQSSFIRVELAVKTSFAAIGARFYLEQRMKTHAHWHCWGKK